MQHFTPPLANPTTKLHLLNIGQQYNKELLHVWHPNLQHPDPLRIKRSATVSTSATMSQLFQKCLAFSIGRRIWQSVIAFMAELRMDASRPFGLDAAPAPFKKAFTVTPAWSQSTVRV